MALDTILGKYGLSDRCIATPQDVVSAMLECLGEEIIEIGHDTYRNRYTHATVRFTRYDLSGHNGRMPSHINFSGEGFNFHVYFEMPPDDMYRVMHRSLLYRRYSEF